MGMNESSLSINKRLLAAEIFSSALCPLDCSYCYIPKTEAMKNLQNKIIEKIKDGSFIKGLEEFYGKNLEHLSFWGAEPTLTLDAISNLLPELCKKFPKLKSISFSTSLMTNPDIIVRFIENLEKANRPFNFKCQISLDGPDFIADTNRTKGVAKKVPENLYYITKKLNSIKLKNVKVDFHLKPTITLENIKVLNNGRIKDYFNYFEEIYQNYKKINKNKNASFGCTSAPTLTVPGKYTSTDGKELALFFKKLRYLGRENKKNKYWEHVRGGTLNNYSIRLLRIISQQNDLAVRPFQFTCSGGDSNFSLGTNNDIRICHRAFFLNNKEYLDSILAQGDIDNWDVSLFQKGNITLLNEKYSINTKTKKDWARVLYVLRGYHDFTRFKNSYVVAVLKELARSKQADKIYLKNDDIAILFALFINSAMACHTENLLNTGSLHLTPVSVIRFFANGAFSEILKDYNENF